MNKKNTTLSEEKVIAALKKLGNGHNIIAANLKKIGISGICGKVNNCPIANFILKKFPQIKRISLAPNDIWLYTEKQFGNSMRIICPKAIRNFIHKFDEQRYPNLISKK